MRPAPERAINQQGMQRASTGCKWKIPKSSHPMHKFMNIAGRPFARAARFPWGFTPAEIAAQLDDIDNHWGEGALVELFHGPTSDLPGVRELFGKLQRSISSPAMAKLWWRAAMEFDVRVVLGTVRVPTLVLARPGDQLVPVESAAALAAAMPNAQFHLLPPGPHNAFDVLHDIADTAARYLTKTPTLLSTNVFSRQ